MTMLIVFLVLCRPSVQEELDSVEEELSLVELQIADLLQKQTDLTARKEALLLQLQEAVDAVQPSSSSSSSTKSSRANPVMSKQEIQHYDSAGTINIHTSNLSIGLYLDPFYSPNFC